jgi:alpha-N-acetylglucosaminidase
VLKEDGQITVNIVGTSGVAAVWGFHHYLKYYCFCHVSWDSDQLALPEDLPPVNITVVSADRLVTSATCSVLHSNFFRYVVTFLE